MKRLILALAILCGFAQAFGQISLDRLRFSASSQPDQDGSAFNASLEYAFSPSLSSSIRFERIVNAVGEALDLGADAASGLPIATASANLQRSDSTELFVLPVQLRLDILGSEGLTLGAGLYASFNTVHDVGFFALNAAVPSFASLPATNSYESDSRSQYYGPVLTLDTLLSWGFLTLRPRIVIVPLFFFTEKSSLEIRPLLASSGKGQISYTSTGLPYISLSATAKLFRLFALDAVYEMNRQDAQLLSAPDTGHSLWWGDPKTIVNTSLKLIGNILIPIGKMGELKLGAGALMSSVSVGGGSASSSSKPVFNIEYTLNR